MPELPEVETIVQQLKKRVIGKKAVKVGIFDKKVVDSEIGKIAPFKFKNVSRRAKLIIFELDNGKYLLTHLKLTGHFHYAPKNQHDRLKGEENFIVAKFYLDDDSLLTFNSVRKFEYMKLINEKQLKEELSRLGVEPLSKEFTLERFVKIIMKKKKANIKALLLDQTQIAGVGNIYSQEALYHAQIDPRRKAESLSSKEIKTLYQELIAVLEKAVKERGTTVESYVHIEGSGGFQKYLAVYGKKNCPKRHELKRIEVGGRGTSYCPKCQK